MRTLEVDTARLCALDISIQLKHKEIVVTEYHKDGAITLYRGEFDDTGTNVPDT